MMPEPRELELSSDSHPDEVARACAAVASRWARRPRSRWDALLALAPHAPPADGVDGDGAWVPAALHAWSRSVRFVREPGTLGERILAPWRTSRVRLGDCDDIATAVATWARVCGLGASVLRVWTGPHTAHVVTVVSPTWHDTRPVWVVDPARAELHHLQSDPYRWGRAFPVE